MIRLAPLLFLALLGCPPPAADVGGDKAIVGGTSQDGRTVSLDLGETLAEIDGVPVGSREFLQVAARRAPGGGAALSEEDRLAVLNELVDQKALYLEAKRQGIEQDPKVQRQMIQILLRRTVYNQVKSNDFTDEDLRAFYEAHRDDFVIPEKVRARRIFVKAGQSRSKEEAKVMADKAVARIGGDIDTFVKVAGELSEGPYRGRGGDMGLITREGRAGMPQDVVDRAFSMKPGEISEAFWAEDGYNIVAVVLRRDKVERTFVQMKGAVLRRAKAERQKTLYDETVARLREGTDIKLNLDKLNTMDFDAAQPPVDPARPGGGPKGRPIRPAPAPLDPQAPPTIVAPPEGSE
ncbi:MAG: peptidyl-prolyl cis-trans isomerase [Myxococcota bacterium]